MWPQDFALMLIDLSGATSDNWVAAIAMTAVIIYFGVVIGFSILATLGIWELLDRREAKKREGEV